ncbi:MAG: Hpt domain-containing protein [Clostridia bacterium]|nr:Hpt domain-containing protein [Clostridia bacterium]
MLTLEKLKEYGADVDLGLSRCANNEKLYIRLVGVMIKEFSSGALGEALSAGDLDRAFELAHKLKGGVTNLALSPIAAPLCELTELLRNKTPGDYKELYAETLRKASELAAL